MREIHVSKITETVAELAIEACCRVGEDLLQALQEARQREDSPRAIDILDLIIENHTYAAKAKVPICQDTGMAVVFADVGQEVHLVGGDLFSAVNGGIAKGYREGYLRKSVVSDPLERVNTGDNTPPILHTRIVPGDRLHISVVPKGGGSENMSRCAMLSPAAGREGVIDFVLKAVAEAGGNPCPPVIVGVGIGGNFETAPLLAKRALLRPVGQPHPDESYAELERHLLTRINALGIGPAGLGGRTTALAVHIETYACHITGIPVAVNLQCHAARHKTAVL